MSVRCLSSYVTGGLMAIRNPQGTEENWIHDEGRIDNYVTHVTKVVTTEIAVALLLITSVVETVAYGVLGVGSLLLLPFSSKPSNYLFNLVSSGAFTIYWNYGNLFVFNFGYANCVTHESFARYSIDHWQRGQVLKVVAAIALLALEILSICSGNYHHVGNRSITQAPFDWTMTRDEDSLYIADWARDRRIALPHQPQPARPGLAYEIARHGGEVNNTIDQGAAFIRDYILQRGQIDEATRQLVLEFDADIYVFVLTRSVYLYVFGPKRNEPVPAFFKEETQQAMSALRNRYAPYQGADLEPLMRGNEAFQRGLENGATMVILNDVKAAAHRELQGSIFLTRCWAQASV